jgi:thiamine kinase-like enzyme
MDFPQRPEDVSAAWLAEVFATDETDVGEVRVEPLGEGVGFTSATCLIRTAGGGDVPACLFAKFATDYEAAAAMAARLELFGREAAFYAELAPELPIRTPRCYFSDFHAKSQRGVILQEDCSGYGLRAQTDEQPTTLAELEAIVDVLARLHGRVDDPSLLQHDWLLRIEGPILQGFFEMIGDNWPTFLESQFVDLLPPGLESQYQRMAEVYTPLVLKHWARSGLSLGHLDYRVDNLFIDEGAEDPVIVFDWQTAVLGRPAYDLAYLLGGSYSPEFRRAHERELVELLCEKLARLGRTDHSVDTAWRDYRFGVFYNQWLLVQGATNLDMSSERGMALARAYVSRFACLFDDYGGVDLIDELERTQP